MHIVNVVDDMLMDNPFIRVQLTYLDSYYIVTLNMIIDINQLHIDYTQHYTMVTSILNITKGNVVIVDRNSELEAITFKLKLVLIMSTLLWA